MEKDNAMIRFLTLCSLTLLLAMPSYSSDDKEKEDLQPASLSSNRLAQLKLDAEAPEENTQLQSVVDRVVQPVANALWRLQQLSSAGAPLDTEYIQVTQIREESANEAMPSLRQDLFNSLRVELLQTVSSELIGILRQELKIALSKELGVFGAIGTSLPERTGGESVETSPNEKVDAPAMVEVIRGRGLIDIEPTELEPEAPQPTCFQDENAQRDEFLNQVISLNKKTDFFMLILGKQYKEEETGVVCPGATKEMFIAQFNLYDPKSEAAFLETFGPYDEQLKNQDSNFFYNRPTFLGVINEEYLMMRQIILESDPLTTVSIDKEKSGRRAAHLSSSLRLLPPEIGRLVNLRKLKLPDCTAQLITLTKEIGKCRQLEELILHNGHLKSLPDEIRFLSKLHTLDLHGNKIKTFPNGFWNLNQLVKLKLDDNKIKELPDITNLTNLRELDVSGNKLGELPPFLWKMTSIEDLSVVHCRISTLPAEVSNLSKLKRLNIGWNELSDLPSEFTKLTNLTDLDLWNNKFNELPEFLWDMEHLKRLRLSKNPLTIIPGHLNKIPARISNLKHLQHLDISDLNLTTIPEGVTSLLELKELRLCENNITHLPSHILFLSNLDSLQIRQNKLTSIAEEFGQLTKLRYLTLCNNNLNALPKSMSKLKSLRILWIRDNPSEGVSESLLIALKQLKADLGSCDIYYGNAPSDCIM